MSSEESIDIRAKGCDREATVSLRQNELIRNLRALVAVRFEQAISRIILVFAGQVLGDEGTIDSKGIVSGVTVHVVCRAEVLGRALPTSSPVTKSPKSGERLMRSWKSANIAYLHDEPDVLRSLLQSDPRIRSLLDENAAMRHYLNSDQNLREMLSLAFSPAKQELGRRRDLHISRMEFVPGGYKVLSRLNYCMLQAYEDNVAMSFQQASQCDEECTNPQRGLEVKDPLPNPWRRSASTSDLRRMRVLARRILAGRDSLTQSGNNTVSIKENPPKHDITCGQVEAAPQIKRGDLRSRKQGRRQHCYQAQLDQLVQMGYRNRNQNKRALLISLGNVDSAVRLLDHWDRSMEE
ncbi:ubiquilin-1 [Drosophila takahashii]|uniref:ubiquilin-1 n=1 Tax=Drosophila takahashii TaxID=29030 RepID=UPI0007E7F0E0|nr:ubiquilin-1 [Drosophila takahashii]